MATAAAPRASLGLMACTAIVVGNIVGLVLLLLGIPVYVWQRCDQPAVEPTACASAGTR